MKSSQTSLIAASRQAIKNLASIPWVWQRISREWSDSELLVLNYHRVGELAGPSTITEDDFRRQIQWLKSRCDFLDPDDLRAFLAGDLRTSAPTVLLTFDDGHSCLGETVCPILRSERIRAIAFLATEAITTGAYLWPDEIRVRLLGNPDFCCDDFLEGAGSRPSRLDVANHVVRVMKCVSDEKRREILDDIRAGTVLTLERAPMITWREARRMADTFHWGAHTHSHPILSRVDETSAREEIRRSKEIVESETAQQVLHFAYPNGHSGDFSETTKRILREEGFCTAFSTEPGYVTRNDDVMSLHRCPSTTGSLRDFAWITARPTWVN